MTTPEPTKTAADHWQDLLDAAHEVLGNAIDSGSYGPDGITAADDADWPRDETGDAWYHDYFALRQAAHAINAHGWGWTHPSSRSTLETAAPELLRTLENLLGNIGHRDDDSTNAPGGLAYNIRAAREAIRLARTGRGVEPVRPKVTIEVLGGVATYRASGDVDVQLFDHDNEPDGPTADDPFQLADSALMRGVLPRRFPEPPSNS